MNRLAATVFGRNILVGTVAGRPCPWLAGHTPADNPSPNRPRAPSAVSESAIESAGVRPVPTNTMARQDYSLSSRSLILPHSLMPMTHTDAGVTIELVQGNIVEQADVDAIVNAANAQLRTGGGVAGAIHRAAGPGLAEETRPLAPIHPGEAVRTSGHDLPNEHVIHVLGPVYGRDEPSDELLRAGYENALRRAEEHGLSSIAFPAISTGAFGFPTDAAARIALQTVLDAVPTLDSVSLIRFVLFDQNDLRIHEEALSSLRDPDT